MFVVTSLQRHSKTIAKTMFLRRYDEGGTKD